MRLGPLKLLPFGKWDPHLWRAREAPGDPWEGSLPCPWPRTHSRELCPCHRHHLFPEGLIPRIVQFQNKTHGKEDPPPWDPDPDLENLPSPLTSSILQVPLTVFGSGTRTHTTRPFPRQAARRWPLPIVPWLVLPVQWRLHTEHPSCLLLVWGCGS